MPRTTQLADCSGFENSYRWTPYVTQRLAREGPGHRAPEAAPAGWFGSPAQPSPWCTRSSSKRTKSFLERTCSDEIVG